MLQYADGKNRIPGEITLGKLWEIYLQGDITLANLSPDSYRPPETDLPLSEESTPFQGFEDITQEEEPLRSSEKNFLSPFQLPKTLAEMKLEKERELETEVL